MVNVEPSVVKLRGIFDVSEEIGTHALASEEIEAELGPGIEILEGRDVNLPNGFRAVGVDDEHGGKDCHFEWR